MAARTATGPQLQAEAARRRLLDGVEVTEHRVELATVPTAVLEAGSGPPMLLLHGPGEFTERWYRVLPGLAAVHHVIAPDFPGHGQSGTSPSGLSASLVFDWIDAVIDRFCDRPPIVVGHILGGSVAARYAAARPGTIERLVLVDSLGLAKFRPTPRFAAGLIGFMVHPSNRSHRRFMHQCLADDAAVQDSMGDRWVALRDYSLDRARDPQVKAAMKFFMGTLGTPPIPDADLRGITVPTTLVWGRHDRANKVRIAEAASERFGWPLHIIESSADDPPMEAPDQFVAAVLAG